MLYSGSHDSHVIEWDLVEGTAQHKWKADRHAVTFVCCHSNDEIILSAGRSIKMWNLSDYTMLQVGQYMSKPHNPFPRLHNYAVLYPQMSCPYDF